MSVTKKDIEKAPRWWERATNARMHSNIVCGSIWIGRSICPSKCSAQLEIIAHGICCPFPIFLRRRYAKADRKKINLKYKE
jgi:hypothetical protein